MNNRHKAFASVLEYVTPEKNRISENGRLPLSVSTVNINKEVYTTYTACFQKKFWDDVKNRAKEFQLTNINYILSSIILLNMIVDGQLEISAPTTESEHSSTEKMENKLFEVDSELKKLNEKFDMITTLLGGRIS